SIHPQSTALKSKNDSVIAQDLWISLSLPQPGRRAFACSRVSEQKLSCAFGIDHSATMHLNPESVSGKVIGDQQFVSGIFQGENRLVRIQNFVAQNQLCAGKVFVYEETFVRVGADGRAAEVENVVAPASRQAPHRAGVE